MRISVRVIPRSSKNSLEWDNGSIRARLTAPPVDGAANAALIELLSKQLNIPKRNIEIVRGTTGKHKVVEITGLTLEIVEQRIYETQNFQDAWKTYKEIEPHYSNANKKLSTESLDKSQMF